MTCSSVQAAEIDFCRFKAAIAQVETGNGVFYRYEPKFYKKYLKGKKKWKKLINKYGKRAISASHGKYQIMYTTAHMYGFRGSPEELAKDDVQEELFKIIFTDLLKKAEGDYYNAIQYYNAGPHRESPDYLQKVIYEYNKTGSANSFRLVNKSKKIIKICKAKKVKKKKNNCLQPS